MNYQLYSKNVDITDSLRTYIDTKLSSIDPLTSQVTSCRVDLSRDQHHRKGDVFRFEINLNIPGALLRAVEVNVDMRAAIDLASTSLEQQVKKHVSRTRDRYRRVRRVMKYFSRNKSS